MTFIKNTHYKNIKNKYVVVVPIHTNYTENQSHTVIQNAELVCVVCSADQRDKFVNLANVKGCESLQYIIQMEPFLPDQLEELKKVVPHITFLTLQQVEQFGAENVVVPTLTMPDDISCLEVKGKILLLFIIIIYNYNYNLIILLLLFII